MKKLKEQILKLREEGLSVRKIAEQLLISTSTVEYHIYPEYRKKCIKKNLEYFKNLPIEKKLKYKWKRREYQRNYQKKRYAEDEEFRNKHKERVRKKI